MSGQATASCDLFSSANTRPLLNEGLLYSGDCRKAVPRQLFTDDRLTPLERNAWQLFRMTLLSEGITPLPTYEQLQPYMTTMPCGAKASHETIARALTLLRLSRWMTQFQRRRDRKTGRLLTNLYVLHDCPLSPFDATKLDPSYLTLVCNSLQHASKAIQRVARRVVQEILLDPCVEIARLPDQLRQLAEGKFESATAEKLATPGHVKSEVNARPSLQQSIAQYEAAPKNCESLPELRVVNPKPYCSTSKTKNKKSTEAAVTIQSSPSDQTLPVSYPTLFSHLKADQQSELKITLNRLAAKLRQPVLDEWAIRCRQQQVRSPAGYLYGLLKKALRGEFKPWACASTQSAPAHTIPPAPQPPAHKRIQNQPTLARTYLAELRAMFNIRTDCPGVIAVG